MRVPRPARLWVAIGVAVLVLAGAATTILLLRGGDDASEATRWTQNDPRKNCPPDGRAQAIAYFAGPEADTAMRRAADRLRGDDKILFLDPGTRDENYVQFKELTADHPELTKLTRKEAMPASVSALPVDGVSLRELTAHLRDVLPDAEVDTGGCAVPAS